MDDLFLYSPLDRLEAFVAQCKAGKTVDWARKYVYGKNRNITLPKDITLLIQDIRVLKNG